jgi:Domain of unknown function (DUF932)
MKTEALLCPAAMRMEPAPNVSKDYAFVPTFLVVNELRKHGYLVSDSNQQGKTPYGPHVVRMRHESMLDERLAPEIVIKNANNGYSKLEFMTGLYRMVCSNGLIVGTTGSSMELSHRKGLTMDAVFDGAKWIVSQAELAIEKSEAWSKVKMEYDARKHFTQLVGLMTHNDATRYNPDVLLRPKYDEPLNLWTCFNLAQENIVQGGMVLDNNQVTRAITGAQRNVQINRKLWNVAENFLL